MPNLFVRQIGEQSGIQLNPTVDRTDGIAGYRRPNRRDCGAVFTVGRIDKAFWVDSQTYAQNWAHLLVLQNLVKRSLFTRFEAFAKWRTNLVSRLVRNLQIQ